MVNFTVWNTYCQEAMKNDAFKTELITFLEHNANTTDTPNQAKWTLSADNKKKFEDNLKSLEFKFTKTGITMKLPYWEQMIELKRELRSNWHEIRQRQLRDYLYEKLKRPFKGTEHHRALKTISEKERLNWFKRFYKDYGQDVGSKGIMDGLFGLFKYQLEHPHRIVEWHITEYHMTQLDEAKMDEFLTAMRGCLGLEYILNKSEDDTPVLVWLTDDAFLDNPFLKKCMQLRKGKIFLDKKNYAVTDIPRQCEGIVSKWFYGLLSLVHQRLKF